MTEPEKPVTSPATDEVVQAVQRAIKQLDEREKAEHAQDKERAAAKERLTSRVSVAAIALTMLMSFLNFARAERDGAASSAHTTANQAKSDAEANWSYYQTRTAERSNYVAADDALQREVTSLPDDDPRVRLAAMQHVEYVARMTAIDNENRQVFFVIQDLEQRRLQQLRQANSIGQKIARYDFGVRVLTLAVVLLSVTLLANRAYLFWVGTGVALMGAAIAMSGYFLGF